jgi:hypothetical protein
MSTSRRRAAGIATACLALFLALPSLAAATKYPPDPAARGFGSGVGGWQSSSSFDGVCLAPLLCPTATNAHQPSGGADGGGYIESDYLGVAGVTAVGGTTTAIWESPTFTYEGAGGNTAGSLAFTMDRRADVAELLGVAGNSATFAVRLIDLSAGGEAVTLIAPTTLAGAESWTDVSRVEVAPGRLTNGHEYRLRVATVYTTGTGVVVTGSSDYDNVVLEALDGGPGGKGGKGRGAKGDDGSDEATQRLAELVRQTSPGTAILAGKGKGSRLLVRVRCPRKAGRTCRITTQGLLKKRKPATKKRTVKVRKGKAKLVVLKVKPKARGKVAKRKRLLVRQKVRAGKVTATVVKSRKLIRREVG